MNWFQSFLVSSIGQKIVMALTGFFLMLFLVVHLVGNLQLLKSDGGEAFNTYTYFMTHNPLIKTVSYLLYATIVLHTIQGIIITRYNKKAAGLKRYIKKSTASSDFAARNMAWLGILIFIFIVLHLKDFWYVMKFTDKLSMVKYPNHPEEVKDLYSMVAVEFKEIWVIVLYSLSMVVLAFHLLHGFASSFRTVGVHHPKYLRIIKFVGKFYAFLIPIGFAIIPIVFYFCK